MHRIVKPFGVFSLAFLVVALSSLAMAAEDTKVEKVGGTYKVRSIVREPQNYFTIIFESSNPTGRFDILKLESDHVHFSLKEGDSIRLSAEVVKESKKEAEVGQVLLFVPDVQGYTPVWLLSRHSKFDDLKAGRYLEMHAPQSDFRIL